MFTQGRKIKVSRILILVCSTVKAYNLNIIITSVKILCTSNLKVITKIQRSNLMTYFTMFINFQLCQIFLSLDLSKSHGQIFITLIYLHIGLLKYKNFNIFLKWFTYIDFFSAMLARVNSLAVLSQLYSIYIYGHQSRRCRV